MSACRYPGCTVELPTRKGRGRPAEYCAEHANERKRDQDKARRINSREAQTIDENSYQCCVDYRKAGNANRRICPQHKTWRDFVRYSSVPYRSSELDRDTIVSLIESGKGIRVSDNPDAWLPVDKDDKTQDKALADWTAANVR